MAAFYKVIACEIALREICHLAARSPSVLELEFLTQGYHDTPARGRDEIQKRIDAAPAGKFDAILLGYGLCSNILVGLTTSQTPLVIPRAHDCIAFFLGSKQRYQTCFHARPGTYYYTAGWLECLRRRQQELSSAGTGFVPAQAMTGMRVAYEEWVKKYGEEQARYLAEVMEGWTANYTHGVLIDFEFARSLTLRDQVQSICARQNWQYEEIAGDLALLQRWLDGAWAPEDFLIVPPGQRVVGTYDEAIIGLASDSQRSGSGEC